MNKHIDDTQLNDYAEGLVTEEATGEMEAHLASCEDCSGRLEALTLLLSDLAGLPDEATPARDLWAGVQAEIETVGVRDGRTMMGGVADDGIGGQDDLSSRRRRSATAQRFSFSAAQLLAASVVWTLLSGGAVWTMLSNGPAQDVVATSDVAPAEGTGGLSESGAILPVTQVATSEYEIAIASLRSVLEQGRDRLSPATVATIEASLTTIDRAIEEARSALADDPNNQGLNRLLIKHQQSKLRVLRQASAAVQL